MKEKFANAKKKFQEFWYEHGDVVLSAIAGGLIGYDIVLLYSVGLTAYRERTSAIIEAAKIVSKTE